MADLYNVNRARERLGIETDIAENSFKIDRTVIDEARANKAREAILLPQELDAKKYDKTLGTAISLGYRLGYIQGLMEVDSQLDKKGLKGPLSNEDRARLQNEAAGLQRDFEAVIGYLPESNYTNLSNAAWNARNAGKGAAYLDVDKTRETKPGVGGILDIDEEARVQSTVKMYLDWALDNNLK